MSLPEIPINHHVSQPITLSDQVKKLKKTLLKDIQRSAYVYRVDCGGCNGCEIEIFSAITPVFDAERFGIKVVASPRHADILLFTGAVTRQMRVPALRAYVSSITTSIWLFKPCLQMMSIRRIPSHKSSRKATNSMTASYAQPW